MDFEDIMVSDVQVEPGASGDSYRFAFMLSRVPERFWPERFNSAYNSQTGLRRIELNENALRIALAEAEVGAYTETVRQAVAKANADYRAEMTRRVTEQQQRLDSEQERRTHAESLRLKAKQALGI